MRHIIAISIPEMLSEIHKWYEQCGAECSKLHEKQSISNITWLHCYNPAHCTSISIHIQYTIHSITYSTTTTTYRLAYTLAVLMMMTTWKFNMDRLHFMCEMGNTQYLCQIALPEVSNHTLIYIYQNALRIRHLHDTHNAITHTHAHSRTHTLARSTLNMDMDTYIYIILLYAWCLYNMDNTV